MLLEYQMFKILINNCIQNKTASDLMLFRYNYFFVSHIRNLRTPDDS